jgi:hypothetical protein
MARESTIKMEFGLEKPGDQTALELAAPGVTKGATTSIKTAAADGAWTSPDAPLKIGGAVVIDGTGWKSLDGKVHVIVTSDNATQTFTIGTDTSAETVALPTDLTAITVKPLVLTHACLSEFGAEAGSPGEIDATTMCDDTRVTLPGLSSPGTANFTGMFDLDDPGMKAFMDAEADGVSRYLVAKTRFGQMAVFHGVVSAFSMGALAVEGVVTFTGSFTMDRRPTYAKAA